MDRIGSLYIIESLPYKGLDPEHMVQGRAAIESTPIAQEQRRNWSALASKVFKAPGQKEVACRVRIDLFKYLLNFYIRFEAFYLKARSSKYFKPACWLTFPRMNNSPFLRNFGKHFIYYLYFFNTCFFLYHYYIWANIKSNIIGIKVIHNDMFLIRQT